VFICYKTALSATELNALQHLIGIVANPWVKNILLFEDTVKVSVVYGDGLR